MLRSIAELAAYGTLAVLLMAASFGPPTQNTASSAATSNTAALERPGDATVQRGALLFATKGCVGCHMHTAIPGAHMQIGPSLTDLPDRAATRVAGLDARGYVRQSLRDPTAYRAPGYSAAMPDLGLSDEAIDALTAFLLSSSY